MSRYPLLLHVDPTAATRDAVRDAFEAADHRVESVATAADARSVAADADPDCVVVGDLADEDPLAVLDAVEAPVRALFPAAGDESLAGAALAAGVDVYVPQADGVGTLVERVAALVGPAETAAPAADDAEWSEYLIEQSPLAIVEWSLDDEIRRWNPAAEELFGYDASTAVGATGMELIGTEESFDELQRTVDRVLADEDRVHSVNTNVRADGTEITCEWYNSPVVEDGEVVGVVSFVRDVTDQTRRTTALESLQRTTRELMRAESKREVAAVVADAVADVVGHDRGVVRLYDPEADHLAVVAASETVRTEGYPLPDIPNAPDEALWESYAAQEPLDVPDIGAFPTDRDNPGDMRALIAHPLGDHGILTVGSNRTDGFDEVDRHLLAVLAATTEAALDRAEREETLVAVERELRERSETIERLHGVVADLDGLDDAAEIWRRAVEAAEEVLNFDECGVDAVEDGQFVMKATSSEIVPDGYSERAPATEGIAGDTYQDGRTYRYDDVRTVFDAEPEHRSYRSLLSVPVGSHGVFQAVSSEVAAFDETDADLAELLMAHVSDALDRVAYETRLRDERDRFAALFENVPDAVVHGSIEDAGQPVVEAVNPAFERVFGWDAETVVGEDLHRFVVPPERRDAARRINERADDGDVIEREVRRRTAEGMREFLLTVVPASTQADDHSAFGVYTDVTERKQREKRVEVLNRVLRHDLRNSMNVIRGSAETLAEDVDPDNEEYVEVIQDRADDLLDLAEKTREVERTLGRDGTGGPVDLVDCVERQIDRLRGEYPDATFSVDAPERAPVRADDLVEAAIFHVLENACRHNDTGTPTVAVGVDVGDSRITVTVADDGPGIPQAERELLTEDREITQLRHASGLGLWLVNWAISQAGGELSIGDGEDRGAVVTLSLPAAHEDDAPAS